MKRLMLLGAVLFTVSCTNPEDHANQGRNDSNYTDDKTLNSPQQTFDQDPNAGMDTSNTNLGTSEKKIEQ